MLQIVIIRDQKFTPPTTCARRPCESGSGTVLGGATHPPSRYLDGPAERCGCPRAVAISAACLRRGRRTTRGAGAGRPGREERGDTVTSTQLLIGGQWTDARSGQTEE